MQLNAPHQRGFSLIELMIGLVLGLIVVGAVSSFAVATLRASSQNERSSRLTQDLRTAMNLVIRELRRSGYDGAAVARLGTGASLSNFTTMQAPPFGPAGCLSYQYDRSGNQFRAIRASNGALEMATATAALTDCGGGNWSVVSDPDVVTVTGFAPAETREAFASIVESRIVGTDTEVVAGCGVVRNVSIDITGSLVSDASISRTIHEEVRVRADPVQFIKQTFAGNGAGIPSASDKCDLKNLCLKPFGASAPDCP